MIRLYARKRKGNLAIGRLLFRNGDKLAIFQNLGIPDYVKVVFVSTNVLAKFASYRSWLMNGKIYPMKSETMLELVGR
jgi:hypothetical protein